jgi:hypothetical protein
MDNQEILRAAQKKVKAKKGFYWHLAVYIAMGIFFGFISLGAPSPGESPLVALIPWSVGLFIHYVAVFGIPFLNVLGDDWERRELEKEINALKWKKHEEENMLLPELEEDMININEHDYQHLKKMRENYRER